MTRMSSSRKQHGNIHRIREFELEKVNLADEFDILQIVGEGWFGKILLVEHRATDTEMVLKALPKPYVSLRDFYREFHYGLHLGVHKNIVTAYDVAFETAGFYVFTQEYASLGDLTSNVSDIGIGEMHTKRVAKQIASALDYMHAKELVHRDIKLDNVLVYRSDFSRVKLCDFGETRKAGNQVQRRNEWLPYSPPEVLLVDTDQTYKTIPSHDIWQFGIVLFVCLTGCLPWQKAASDDPRYVRYLIWQNSSMVILIKRTPKLFKLLTSRACKLFRKFLEPVPERRPKNLEDLQKYLDDRWLAKNAEKDMIVNEPDELCASMYSFHSSPEEKNKILFALAQHGIETTVDRVAKKKRIRDWIQQSVIQEDDEEDENDSCVTEMMSRAPVAGHISSVRAAERASRKQITSTIKDASNKHINPRTLEIQSGPSEMGSHIIDKQNSNEYMERFSQAEKLIDAESQTSIESHTPQFESSSHSPSSLTPNGTPNGSQQFIQSNQTLNSTSRGLMSAFNSLVTIPLAESQPIELAKPGSLQRHNTIASPNASINILPNNLINDSGYGSLDRLKGANGNSILSSPLLAKRMIINSKISKTNQSKSISALATESYPNRSTKQNNGTQSNLVLNETNKNGTEFNENNNNNLVISRKDTAYDRVKVNRRRKF